MFHFTGFSVTGDYVFIPRRLGMIPARLPHSEMHGSKRICRSPCLIAAYHVLHRLLAPRHPSCALCSLINLFPLQGNSIVLSTAERAPSSLACARRRTLLRRLSLSSVLEGSRKSLLSLFLYYPVCRCQRTSAGRKLGREQTGREKVAAEAWQPPSSLSLVRFAPAPSRFGQRDSEVWAFAASFLAKTASSGKAV